MKINPMVTCKRCGKTVKGVTKQNPDMPKGIKSIYPSAHKCVNGDRWKA